MYIKNSVSKKHTLIYKPQSTNRFGGSPMFLRQGARQKCLVQKYQPLPFRTDKYQPESGFIIY